MTSLIYKTDRQLDKIIAEIARSLDPNFGLKAFCLECDPSHNGERYYKQGRLSQLCLECVTSSFQERDAFDMAGTYIVQEEGNYFSDRFKQCVICKRYLCTHLLTFEGLQMCLLSPEYSHCPYPYLYLKNTQLMFWRTLVICRSARYWVQVLLDLSEPSPFIDHIKTFAERLQKTEEYWLTQAHSGFLSFEVKGQKGTMKPVLHVEAAYAEGDQDKSVYDMDVLFVNGLCRILGIDSQVWVYTDPEPSKW